MRRRRRADPSRERWRGGYHIATGQGDGDQNQEERKDADALHGVSYWHICSVRAGIQIVSRCPLCSEWVS
jgi:hypothetical protein